MINNVIEIAKRAGEIIREGYGKNFEIEYKTNELNLVTEIDKKSEYTIKQYIKKNFPGHGILAEESGSEKGSGEFNWIVDPLDGTTNFAHGLPIFSVSIGIMKGNETICGVVYDVMRDALYTAELSSGAFLNGNKINVKKNNNLATSVLVTGFPYDIKENPDNAIEKFASFLTSCRAVRRLGSAAIDFCYVAQGVFEGFWEVSLNPWDVCAGKLIVEEAGGLVTDFNGNQISPFSKQILATNGGVHNSMLEIINNSKASYSI
ncbi:MAG: inositol monophosphatase [Melioribacteraceae bacterium]|nr:inositol monophosphatase [Melioribacteraceae bacterium]